MYCTTHTAPDAAPLTPLPPTPPPCPDNPALHEAVQRVRSGGYTEVVPVYVHDPRAFAPSPWGHTKTGPHRARFLMQALADLRARLRGVGSDLLVAVGRAEEVVGGLVRGCTAPVVVVAAEVTSEETRVEAAVERAVQGAGGRVVRVWGHTLYHLDDLQAPSGPYSGAQGVRAMGDVFTPFKDKCERGVRVRAEVAAPAPGALPLPPRATPLALSQTPGGAGCESALGALLDLPLPGWGDLPWKEGTAPPQPAPHPNAVMDFEVRALVGEVVAGGGWQGRRGEQGSE